MNFLTVIIICLSVLPLHPISSHFRSHKWQDFKKYYNRKYGFDEESIREEIFNSNIKIIEKHNRQTSPATHSFKLSPNKFTDLNYNEFSGKHMGLKGRKVVRTTLHRKSADRVVLNRTSFDWREKGVINKVKDQKDCGACYAFTSIASIESAHAIRNGKMVSLSEQNIVDCSWLQGNEGCNGGLITTSYQYVRVNKGVDTETSYPYIAKDQPCRFNRSTIGATLTSWKDIEEEDEDGLLDALVNEGPVAVGIHASLFLQLYQNGIFKGRFCSKYLLNHSVLIVGYGTENGTDYWIAKNSWGEDWGENGYFRIERHRNACGIASMASYPII